MREFELIDAIRTANGDLGPTVELPPGDDLGMIALPAGGSVLAGVDQVVGGVHLPEGAAPEHYGRKVVARSLSDVAAMAAVPVGVVVSATLPPDLLADPEWGGRFADSARELCASHGAPLFGGDVACHAAPSGPVVAAATVLAIPDPDCGGRVLRRSGARPGDLLCVSGRFGASLAPDGLGHHVTFEPRIALARRLHRTLGAGLTAMIDVSDGLAADAGHLARESAVSITLDAEAVPRREGAGRTGALTDGEDHELCFTIAAEVAEGGLPEAIDGVPLTVVGTVAVGEGLHVVAGGEPIELDRRGWEHAG